MTTSSISANIATLQATMQSKNIDAYLIPGSDPHQSEYVAAHWQGRAWISGFTGSAGTVIITTDHAGLWTDSRYFIQAEQQLENTPFELHKLQIPHTPEYIDWLVNRLGEGSVVGLDGRLFSVAQVRKLANKLEQKNIRLQTDIDLLSAVWKDRPSMPGDPVKAYTTKYAGKSRKEKLAQVKEKMKAYGADWYLVTTLDDIAWSLNLRGSDVEANPVFIACLLIGSTTSYLFIDKSKILTGLERLLLDDGISLKEYNAISTSLQDISEREKILVDKGSINMQLFNDIAEECRIEGTNLIAPLKTIKNQTEIKHLRRTMEKDAVALVRLYRWLSATLAKGTVLETEVAKQLERFRSEQPLYMGESFSAIVGYKSNGAIVHYRAEEGHCAQIHAEGMLLIDSGGQYQDGTTDITRTVCLGKPTAQQKEDFTLVLKGMIDLSMARFPKGTTGVQLDTLARQHLWRNEKNYGHGTGHGVGFFLNVHEGPQAISPVLSSRTKTAFQPGMVTSNEPGLYRTGEYGIRIENLILCKEADENAFGEFLQFETLTLFPIEKQLINKSMLDKEEIQWLNQYHKTVAERLSPYLEEAEKNWLDKKCSPL